MTLSILFLALLGVVTGYPLMKLDLKSVQREKVRKILDIVSQGLAAAVCVLPLMLFRFSPAVVLVGLLAVASLRKTYAATISAFGLVYLLTGWYGLLLSIFCPGILLIPMGIIFLIVRSHSKAKQYTSLGIKEDKKLPAQQEIREIKPAPKYSLRLTALYCSLFIMVIEFGSLNVGAIQVFHKREKALPRLVQASSEEPYDALEALKEYGKEAVPFEIDMIRQQFKHSLIETNPPYSNETYIIARLTTHILEMGEAESLSQLGENQQKALRACASRNSAPVKIIAINELTKLKAIPDLVSLLNSSDYREVMDGILQFSPNETIPTFMEWKAKDKQLIYADERGNNSGKDENYSLEIAKYGAPAVPVLMPYIGDQNSKVKDFATQILLKIGESAVPALKQILTSKNNTDVTQAAYILGMLGDKSALPVLIENIKNGDHSLSEALSFISDERATQCLITAHEAEKNLLTEYHNKNDQSLETYELLIANTKTDLAKIFLERTVDQIDSITHRKKLLDALCNDFWIGTRREKITAWIETLQNFSGADAQEAAVELRKIGDPVVLPFLIEADDREHGAGLSIQKCEIHAAIAALSK